MVTKNLYIKEKLRAAINDTPPPPRGITRFWNLTFFWLWHGKQELIKRGHVPYWKTRWNEEICYRAGWISLCKSEQLPRRDGLESIKDSARILFLCALRCLLWKLLASLGSTGHPKTSGRVVIVSSRAQTSWPRTIAGWQGRDWRSGGGHTLSTTYSNKDSFLVCHKVKRENQRYENWRSNVGNVSNCRRPIQRQALTKVLHTRMMSPKGSHRGDLGFHPQKSKKDTQQENRGKIRQSHSFFVPVSDLAADQMIAIKTTQTKNREGWRTKNFSFFVTHLCD